MAAKKPAKKQAAKTKTREDNLPKYSAFAKKKPVGKGGYQQRLAEQRYNLKHGFTANGKQRKGLIVRGSDVDYKISEKARRESEKYAGSRWKIADDVASEILKSLTAAPQVKKALHGKAGLKDYAEILGTAATYAVPYGKIGRAINAASSARTAKGAVKTYKSGERSVKAAKATRKAQEAANVVGKTQSKDRVSARVIKSVKSPKKTVRSAKATARGAAKSAVYIYAGDAVAGATKSGVMRAGNVKRRKKS